jgi:hypothetical protein
MLCRVVLSQLEPSYKLDPVSGLGVEGKPSVGPRLKEGVIQSFCELSELSELYQGVEQSLGDPRSCFSVSRDDRVW